MLRKIRNRDKKIKLYFVEDVNNLFLDENETILNILCVTKNKKEALEFINKKIYSDHYNHFGVWCNLKNLQVSQDAWNLYYSTVLQNENPYITVTVNVDYSMISSIFRIFYGCKPIGCSFDTMLEKLALDMSLSDDQIKADC